MVQTMFGGSVGKGTDVAGLSDVDALLIVNESSLVNRPPSDVHGLREGPYPDDSPFSHLQHQ